MKTITVKIKGMHCKSCEVLITDDLKETGAVSDVQISHKTGQAKITFDEKNIDEKKIKAVIKQEGYTLA
ncbi:MAG TPA: heavy-metal-associated domain-containing protein [Candidatus Nanoarchaeia archaeon]|nr:heavy-metal-associated domain-containing protein [Candidatus Nanoarchaeia archaeon]